MPSLKTLGLAAAIGLIPACEKPAEQPEPPKQKVVAPSQEVSSACERFRAAIGVEAVIEQMAQGPAAWKYFPAPLAEAAWKDAHAEAMAAAAEVKDQGACLRTIRKDE